MQMLECSTRSICGKQVYEVNFLAFTEQNRHQKLVFSKEHIIHLCCYLSDLFKRLLLWLTHLYSISKDGCSSGRLVPCQTYTCLVHCGYFQVLWNAWLHCNVWECEQGLGGQGRSRQLCFNSKLKWVLLSRSSKKSRKLRR